MELLKNVVEYYEELFPVTPDQKKFFEQKVSEYPHPVKFLGINCGTGIMEHSLSKDGHDVTGIDELGDLIESANRRRRTQLMFLRFFEMNTLEMSRFLGKKFYNLITLLENRIVFIHDKTLIAKFFYDCHELIADGGQLIIKLYNYDKFNSETIKLPVKESIRTKLFSKIQTDASGKKYMTQELESGNGKRTRITEDAEIYPLTKKEIQQLTKDAGFSNCEFYSDFDCSPLNDDSDEIVAVIS